MPVHPYDPYGDDPDRGEFPDIDQIIDRIINGNRS